MTKQQLRQQYLTKRGQLEGEEYQTLNYQLLQQFQQLDFAGVNCIHMFLPMEQNKEPDTYLLREWLKDTHPRITIVFPKTNFRTLQMISYTDDADLVLAVNSYGITEPTAGNEVSAKEIDMVLLPLLAFDTHGYRVGYGKGFYDRFVQQCRPDVWLLGLSLFEPVKQIADVNPYDLRMHACITPGQRYNWPR